MGLLGLGACGPTPGNPVVFGQAQTLGVSVGQGVGTPAPEFTLGYSDANIAILPTGLEVAPGTTQELGARAPNAGNAPNDTYSVFGQFGARGGKTTSGNGSFALEKFFATGAAAQNLSQGFACAASDGRASEHCHNTTSHTQTPAPASTSSTGSSTGSS
ncbi:hypothetical protein EBB79_11510 [Parasedimentitalea marina]|uniref:Uncharacterized protein n=1 Tax=Parasedimentitalea marina TaxID=2483033 RepID=A0A3T0N348_9RHOB|nr:hypothetical protein EBB79_11510 [Parasedimentitalea marina]